MALYAYVEVLAEGITLPDGQVYKLGATITCSNGEIIEIPPDEHELCGPLCLGEDRGYVIVRCSEKANIPYYFCEKIEKSGRTSISEKSRSRKSMCLSISFCFNGAASVLWSGRWERGGIEDSKIPASH
mgnify:CR=1 FL=1